MNKSEHFGDLPLPVKRELVPDDVKNIRFKMEVTVELANGTTRLYEYETGLGWRTSS